MTIAIYSLSADPITFGHINIIERASKSFTKVIIAIGNNNNKKYLLTQEERLKVAKESLLKYKNIEVCAFNGLLVDFAFKKNANVIIRGLRNPNDFLYEQDLNSINNSIDVGFKMDTYYLLASPSQYHISSSSAKALVKEYCFTEEYLPLSAKSILEQKINSQLIIGITGLIGCNTSDYLSKIENGINIKINDNLTLYKEILNLDLDEIINSIYNEISISNKYSDLKVSLINEFGTIKKNKINKIVYKNKEKLKKLENLIFPILFFLIRQKIINFKGVILINAVNILTTRFLKICNNNIIFLSSKKSIRMDRLKKNKNINNNSFFEISKIQKNKKEQLEIFKKNKKENGYGNILILNTDKINENDFINKFCEYIKKIEI